MYALCYVYVCNFYYLSVQLLA